MITLCLRKGSAQCKKLMPKSKDADLAVTVSVKIDRAFQLLVMGAETFRADKEEAWSNAPWLSLSALKTQLTVLSSCKGRDCNLDSVRDDASFAPPKLRMHDTPLRREIRRPR